MALTMIRLSTQNKFQFLKCEFEELWKGASKNLIQKPIWSQCWQFLGEFTNEFSEQISKCEPEVDSGTLKSGTTGKGNKSDPDVGGQMPKWVSTTKFQKCEPEEVSGTLKRDNKSFGSIHEWASSVSLCSFHCSWYTPVQCTDLSRFKLLECYPFATNFWSHHHPHCCTLLCK